MEICYKAVNGLEFISGIDKYFSPSASGVDNAVLVCDGLKGPCARRADGYYSSAVFSGIIYLVSLCLFHHVILRMHLVVCHVLYLHRAECAKSDVKGDMGYFHSHFLYLLKELLRKVQSRRGSRRRALMDGVNCLVPVFVLQLMRDVGRQGHLSKLVKNSLKHSVVAELDYPVSSLYYFQYLGLKPSVAENYHVSELCLFTGICKHFPSIHIFSHKKKYLHPRSGVFSRSDKPCGHYLCVVYDKAVALFKIILYVSEYFMLYLPAVPMQNQKPRGRTVLQRLLSYKFLWEIIIKIACFHFVSPFFRLKYHCSYTALFHRCSCIIVLKYLFIISSVSGHSVGSHLAEADSVSDAVALDLYGRALRLDNRRSA